jgi:hypothetical protein
MKYFEKQYLSLIDSTHCSNEANLHPRNDDVGNIIAVVMNSSDGGVTTCPDADSYTDKI